MRPNSQPRTRQRVGADSFARNGAAIRTDSAVTPDSRGGEDYPRDRPHYHSACRITRGVESRPCRRNLHHPHRCRQQDDDRGSHRMLVTLPPETCSFRLPAACRDRQLNPDNARVCVRTQGEGCSQVGRPRPREIRRGMPRNTTHLYVIVLASPSSVSGASLEPATFMRAT